MAGRPSNQDNRVDMDIPQHAIVREFTETASRFCSLLEGASALSAYQLAREVAVILPELYRLGLLLPDVNPKTERPIDGTVSHDKVAELRRGIQGIFGKLDLYREIFDAYENPDDEPVIGSVGDDLSSIYGELQDGLVAFVVSPEEAVWHWKFGFINHWGRHLVSALRSIHHLFSDYLLTDDTRGSAGHSS
jgi:hypothetical protein